MYAVVIAAALIMFAGAVVPIYGVQTFGSNFATKLLI